MGQGSRTESAAAGGVQLEKAPHEVHEANGTAVPPAAAPLSLDSASREIAEVLFSPQATNHRRDE